ncbi:putative flavin containing amine oxidase [Aspergillus flavus AF70]|nr:putative flavin containing amine oxidase [Aspergillus flavus AF70]
MAPPSNEGFLWTPHGSTSGLETDAVQESSLVIHDSYDVVVIGAGFTGLIAARELSQRHDLKVLLLEARDRIGGRTWTARALGEELEMGGTWVHWAQPHLYSELRRYGLHINLKTSAGTAAPTKQMFKQGKATPCEISIEETGDILERIAQSFFTIDGSSSRELMPYPHDPFKRPALWMKYDHLSVQDRLDSLRGFSSWEKDLFESNTSTFGSAPGKDIAFTEALRWYALGGHNMKGVFELAGVYKIGNGGMTSFARAVLGDYTGHMLLGATVKEVAQTKLGVRITTRLGQEINAKYVVSTIPLNCLADVKFYPPISSSRQSAMTKGHINKGAKIHFKLKAAEPGWFATANSSDSAYVFAFSDHNGTRESEPSGTWCIGFGYNGRLDDKNNHRHIIDRFRKDIYPTGDVEAYVTHDWVNDPYAKGAWACWGPGCATAYLQELQKPHGRVIFASADWADGWRGFVDGAIEQGHQASQCVVASLKSETETLRSRL